MFKSFMVFLCRKYIRSEYMKHLGRLKNLEVYRAKLNAKYRYRVVGYYASKSQHGEYCVALLQNLFGDRKFNVFGLQERIIESPENFRAVRLWAAGGPFPKHATVYKDGLTDFIQDFLLSRMGAGDDE